MSLLASYSAQSRWTPVNKMEHMPANCLRVNTICGNSRPRPPGPRVRARYTERMCKTPEALVSLIRGRSASYSDSLTLASLWCVTIWLTTDRALVETHAGELRLLIRRLQLARPCLSHPLCADRTSHVGAVYETGRSGYRCGATARSPELAAEAAEGQANICNLCLHSRADEYSLL